MEYLANQKPDNELIDSWIEQFHRDGCLFLPNVLPPDLCAQLRQDLDNALDEEERNRVGIQLHHRMFETSPTNLGLFDLEPIVTFAERLITHSCHVIHNNSFRSPPGAAISNWHQDDAPHFEITHGDPPDNVRLPVLLFTCNYYLTDVDTVDNGPTQTVPRSHLFGSPLPNPIEGSDYEDQVVSNLGSAGSVIMFNNQVWHRGAPNYSDRVRYLGGVTYSKRFVAQKLWPFIDYRMPEHVWEGAGARLQRMLGRHERGAYG